MAMRLKLMAGLLCHPKYGTKKRGFEITVSDEAGRAMLAAGGWKQVQPPAAQNAGPAKPQGEESEPAAPAPVEKRSAGGQGKRPPLDLRGS
jgi:hypothetical protein